MSTIQVARYPDRGFARIGRAGHHLTEKVRSYCQKGLSDVYEVDQSGDDVWLRSKERREQHYIDCVEELAVVDATSNRDAKWITNIEPYYDRLTNQIANTDFPVSLMSSMSGRDLHDQIYRSSLAFLHVHSNLREAFLRDFYFPWFFGLFPAGKILALKFNSSYVRRVALLRWGNLLSIYDASELDHLKNMPVGRIQMMSELHQTGTINAKPHFLAISNLFYPYAHSFVLGGNGYLFVLFTNETSIIDRGPYPQTMMDIHRTHGLMMGQAPDLTRKPTAEEGWLGRYVPSRHFSADELLVLFRHFISRFNHTLRLRIDVTNYRDGDDIDFISAFEEYFTFDRLTLELNYCQTAVDGFTARASSFAVLDKMQELISIPTVSREKLFHYFVGKAFAQQLVLFLQKYPVPFSAFFADECDRIYDRLHQTVLGEGGLWMKYRRQEDGIHTREWDKTSKTFIDHLPPYTEDEFVGEVVRAIRNTHHGYISDNDKRRRFAVFVSMHTGQLADEFTAIPELIWLSVIQNPESTILTNCITDQKLWLSTY